MFLLHSKQKVNFLIFQFSHRISVVKFYILPIFIFSILYNFPKFFELSVCTSRSSNFSLACIEDWENNTSDLENTTFIQIKANPLRLEPHYVKYYLIYLNFVVHGLIPFIVLITLTIQIYRKVFMLSLISHDYFLPSALLSPLLRRHSWKDYSPEGGETCPCQLGHCSGLHLLSQCQVDP